MTEEAVMVRAVRSNGACVLRIGGVLDMVTADTLAFEAAAAVLAVPGPVLIDLSGLVFMDARGAQALDALIKMPPDGRPAAVRRCPLRVRRILNILQLSLDCQPADDEAARPTALTERVRLARLKAGQARLDASGTLSRLTDTLIRLASTRERTDLVREQGREALASSRAAREQVTKSRRAAAG